jgi:2-C-methyl-D-erythritol 4-phosphate cytidylyltransferase/2-C-methyl-D-erythritol 2,4-cyclodiphosphate synthase
MTSCIALVVAAGRGTRLGSEQPKQYLPLGGMPVLRRSLCMLENYGRIDAVRVVYHPDDHARYVAAVDGLHLLPPIAGGATRQDSVRLGLESLTALNPRHVVIHDAARPFADHALMDRVMDALDRDDGAIPALRINDTVKRGSADHIEETIDRRALWRAQTPQGFRFEAILAAHRNATGKDLPDDAAVAERSGLRIRLVEGSDDNFKITTAEDLKRAERLVTSLQGDVRTGMGFDVHAFGPGDHVWLCGVRVAHEFALVGHSDSDAGLHALTDAILGALGMGDIGEHFPPSDPQWRGAPSHLFLSHAASLVTQAGGHIAHVDVTLVCERPKIAPQRDAMVMRIAEILSLTRSRVSVKATTTERLGFTGRGEGIAACAVATLRLPL